MNGRLFFSFACALVLAAPLFAQERLNLQDPSVGTNGWFKLQISPAAPALYSVEASSSLTDWREISLLLGTELYTNSTLPFIDSSSGANGIRFYRVRTSAIAPTNDWKNQVYHPYDPFLSETSGLGAEEVRWIKFAITTNEPQRVYFQDSSKYVFHYDFATARLPGFQGMSRAQFDEFSLRTNSQKVVVGTVLYAPLPAMRQAAIQFVGLDAYTPEQVATWFDIVRAAIVPLDSVKVVYMPVYEQARVAEENRTYLAERGIELASLADWTPGNDCYSSGWAIGTLKYFPAAEVQAAIADGRLLPTDILLIDSVPAELPFLAGILTLNPATPNSHVAILAQSYGIPFSYLAAPELRAAAQSLLGRQVVFDTSARYGGCQPNLVDLSGASTQIRQDIAQLKAPPLLSITPKARLGSYTTNAESLFPADIQYVGGKAANFGFIRRTVPTNSPTAIAITFDLWDDFMDQVLPTGKTLRQEINDRLSKYTTYPPDFGALRADLTAVRNLIQDNTAFTQAQVDAIAAALLGRFEPNRKIRFRSSTNVEDSENFTGAGLYDSYSGCLADDRDGDTTGPSICDPEEPRERGVFRAIRKVYASFYNENAFLERLRHKVDESKVGMAILVHHSSPDPIEMANGVATVRFEKGPESHSYTATIVTQKGAVSVTNPDGSAVPEVVQVSKYSFGTYAQFDQRSSLVPLGGYVLNWGKDGTEYKQFAELFSRVATAFEGYYPAKTNYTLDFEFKKIEPGVHLVKQVREIPVPDPDQQFTTYLLNAPGRWCVFQGEYGDVFANHRLKSTFDFSTRELKLDLANLGETIFASNRFIFVDGAGTNFLEGSPSSWPEAAHTSEPLTDSWTAGTSLPRRFTLETILQRTVSTTHSPVLTLRDAELYLQATYTQPQLGFNNFGQLDNSVTNEFVRLVICPQTNANSIPVTREVEAGGAVARVQFYWPGTPSGVTVGYTAPLVAWKETVLTGITSQPIVLRGYYSQTYRPQHHNFSEDFLFEPRLEPGIDPALIAELESKNIRQIWVHWEAFPEPLPSTISYIGTDGKLRSAAK